MRPSPSQDSFSARRDAQSTYKSARRVERTPCHATLEQAEASFAHSLAQQALFRGGAFLRIASLVVGDAIRSGEMPSNRREDHEVSMLALHLLQKYMVYINTLIISSDQPLRGGRAAAGPAK